MSIRGEREDEGEAGSTTLPEKTSSTIWAMISNSSKSIYREVPYAGHIKIHHNQSFLNQDYTDLKARKT